MPVPPRCVPGHQAGAVCCGSQRSCVVAATGTFGDYLVNTSKFDPDSPAEVGAIAFRPYHGPHDDGSIALYVGPHQLIQSIPGEGVTDNYTDQQTYSWNEPRYHFTVYGFLPRVNY